MGAAGLVTARQYAWDRVAEQIMDFYVKTGSRTYEPYGEALRAGEMAL
jgi:hypothetical protein